MKFLSFLTFTLVSISIFAVTKQKPIPPGTSMSATPNVLFVIDDSGSMGWGYTTPMRVTKRALNRLLDNTELIESMRMGLSDFPNSYWNRQFLVPIRNTTGSHVQTLRNKINGLVPSGGTPLREALVNSEAYYRGNIASNYSAYVNTDTTGMSSEDWKSPINDICQKSYVILFTDGQGSNPSYQARAMSTPYNGHGLKGITPNGIDVADKKILTYAIGFGAGAGDVNYIAVPGGTEHGYQANNETQLLNVFTNILKDIQSKNSVAATPTIVPNYSEEDKDVMYLTSFLPRKDKQWSGELTKYRLKANGYDKLWEFSEKLKTQNRNIKTICNGMMSFDVNHAAELAKCMYFDGGGSVEICDEGDWSPKALTGCDEWTQVAGEANKCYPRRGTRGNYANDINNESITIVADGNGDQIEILLEEILSINAFRNDRLLGGPNGYYYLLSDYIMIDLHGGIDNGKKIIVTKMTGILDKITVLKVNSSDIETTLLGRLKVKEFIELPQNGSITLNAEKAIVGFYSDGVSNGKGPKISKNYRTRQSKVCYTINTQTPVTGIALETTKRLINFFRGNDSFQDDKVLSNSELQACKNSSNCPKKNKVLADLYNSRVKYLGKPNQFYTYSSYESFKSANKNVTDLLLVGSNGGMLHAVRPNDGNEEWAFIPPNLLTALKTIIPEDGRRGSVPRFFVDASPKIMDVYDKDEGKWKTLALITFGEGREGLMVLDLTGAKRNNPEFLWAVLNLTQDIYKNKDVQDPNCENHKQVVYWSKTGAAVFSNNGNGQRLDSRHALLDLGGNLDYSNLSKTWSEPVIAQLGGSKTIPGRFVAVFGGGGVEKDRINTNLTCAPGKANKDIFGSSLYFVDVFTGNIIKRFDVESIDDPARIPSTVTVLPEYKNSGSNNRIIKNVYFGDLAGHIWRVNPNMDGNSNICGKADSSCKKVFSLSLGENKKFYKGLSLSYTGKPKDSNRKLWVFAGTGNSSIYNLSENTSHAVPGGSLYGIVDKTWEENTPNIIPESEVRNFTSGSSCTGDIKAWEYKLGKNERLITRPSVIDGYVYYVTYVPGTDTGNVCVSPVGTSYLYSFKIRSKCSEDANGEVKKVKLGKGMASAPVVKGDYIYIGISGSADETPSNSLEGFSRTGNIIKWKRKPANSKLNSKVNFSFFRELY